LGCLFFELPVFWAMSLCDVVSGSTPTEPNFESGLPLPISKLGFCLIREDDLYSFATTFATQFATTLLPHNLPAPQFEQYKTFPNDAAYLDLWVQC